ncbi:hypothetical protein KUV65_12910 [Maritalea mobilis]|uniref:hypothetical protein n=1 Tax=Maritalea mobilis TaxID=483324 RepID=UPI001C98B2F5|nr:hypothetical protein [Maritalea mobilis]MBY6202270.1 hypothetical protein [Maritalea mobilis]
MTRSRLIPLAVAALLAAAPAHAQDDDGDMSEGLGLLREGSRMILENLLDEMRPMLEEARPFFEDEMLPFLQELGRQIDDLTAYELPERLPNGDIIIRRSPDAPPIEEDLPEVGEDGEVEL